MGIFKGVKIFGVKYDALGKGTTYNATTEKVENFTAKDESDNDITLRGLATALAGKADSNHTHSGYAPTVHEHSYIKDGNGDDDSLNYAEVDVHHIDDAPVVEINLARVVNEEYTEKNTFITLDNIDNLSRALENPAAPAEDGNKLITNGQVYTALASKSDTNHTHSGYAAVRHTHLPVDIQGVIPTFASYNGVDKIDLDGVVDDDWGMNRLCIQNNGSAQVQIADLFTWDQSIPVHINANSSVNLSVDDYVMVTIYKIDKNMNPDDEHEHDLCYFITIDGIFDNGNSI